MQQSRSLLTPFALGHFCNDFAPCAVWIIAPAFAVAMDLNPAQLGLLFTIHSIGSAIAFLPAGLAADHISDRGRLLLLTFWWVGLGYFAASFAPGYWSFALLLAIGGMGDAVWHPVAAGTLVQQAPAGKAKALGIHAMGGAFAEVLGPLLAGFLLAHMDWRGALQVSVIPAFAMGIVFYFVSRNIPKRQTTQFSRHALLSLWQTWRTPSGMKVVGLIAIYNMSFMALLSMTPLYLQRRHDLGPEMTGIAFSVMLLVGALTQPLLGSISDRLGRRSIVISGNLLAATAAGLTFIFKPLLMVLGLLIIAIGTLTAIRSVLLASAVEHAGSREATTLGLAFVVLDGVGALGALLAGAVGTLQLEYAFALAAVLSLMAVGFSLSLPKEQDTSVT